MSDLYFCGCCGYALIFRNVGKKTHHPFHIPTGWPCWRENGICNSILLIDSKSNPEHLLGIKEKSDRLISTYLDKNDYSEIPQKVVRFFTKKERESCDKFINLVFSTIKKYRKKGTGEIFSEIRKISKTHKYKLFEQDDVLKNNLDVNSLTKKITELAEIILIKKREKDANPIRHFFEKQMDSKFYDCAALIIQNLAKSDEGKINELAVKFCESESWKIFIASEGRKQKVNLAEELPSQK